MTLDPGPAYAESTTAEARAERNAQINNAVDDIVMEWAKTATDAILSELQLHAPEALFDGSFAEAAYAGGKNVGYRLISSAEVAPYLAECLREFVMTLDGRVDEQ